MNTPSLSLFYSVVLSFLFVFESYAYFSSIIPILIDRSFGDETEFNSKLNRRKAVLRSWFFGSFSIACGYALFMIKHNENKYLILFYFVIGIVLMFLLHYLPKKIENNVYYKDFDDSTPIVKVLDDLKKSKFNEDEIRSLFDNALKYNYFNCEFYQFERLIKLEGNHKKINWLPVGRKKIPNKKLLLSFLNEIFGNQFIKIDKKVVCSFINNNFDLKDYPMNPDNVGKWVTGKNKEKA
ncbi:MAG: hypothetical protein GZ091_09910 [Paludibacter sp.]|nr:hypothetical protein [Paludibacter sp.]